MDKFINYITRACKFSWNVFSVVVGTILCSIIVIIILLNWLGFFGIIPQGDQPTMRDDRYEQERHDQFR